MTGFPNSDSICQRGLMDLVYCAWLNADACLDRGDRRGSSRKDEFRLKWLKATSNTGADVPKLTALHLLLPTQLIFFLTATPPPPHPPWWQKLLLSLSQWEKPQTKCFPHRWISNENWKIPCEACYELFSQVSNPLRTQAHTWFWGQFWCGNEDFSKKMFFQNTVCWIKLKQQDGFHPQYI